MALVSGVIGSLLRKLGDLLKEEYGLQKGVKKKIEALLRELREVYTVLRKIGDVPWDQLDEQVRLWASDLREASYDMEDIVDTFLVHVDAPEPATETHKLRRLRKKVSSLFKKTMARRNISSQIKEICNKLEELAERRDRYKTPDSIVTKPATTIDPRILSLYKSATALVGIEGPKNEIIDMLSLGDDNGDVSGHKIMKTISVVGIGGLGKTTLAKAVYDQLKPHFELGAFIPMGRNPDIKKVLRDILIDLDKEKFMNLNMAILDVRQLLNELSEFIKEKRYLIVIDDIWDKDSCKLIKCALQESNCGSRLVITTRIFEVATQTDQVYKLQPLSHDNSEKLLFARVSDSKGKYLGSPSVEACERILKKCSGVPLAVITIASLLASRPGKDWSEVYNSIGFGHEDNDDVNNTRQILSFSYYDLPSHLKACLLYLGMFPEDKVIEKNKLIWMWIAEGFISEEQAAVRVGLFDLGERYFNELINRNLIQAQKTREYVYACSVHDMVLDLIHQLSSEEKFVTVLNGGGQQKLQGSISRRLSLQCVEDPNIDLLANIAVEKVRSIFASVYDFFALCPRLPFLRVVETVDPFVSENSYGDIVESESLIHLGSLLHLRYLKLDCIENLPMEIRHLRFLQTLNLESLVEVLPEELGLLTQLTCLQANYAEISVPAGLIGKLTSLQELGLFCKDEEDTMHFVKELGLLRELRVLSAVLCIHLRSESIKSALLESLGFLQNIKELEIRYAGLQGPHWMNRDTGWASCRQLRLLDVDCFEFSSLPAWINSSLAPNLSHLYLNVVVVKDQEIETLAKLPELICLVLQSENYTRTRSVASIRIRTGEGVGYFHKLRSLTIHASSIWFDLNDSECNSSRVAPSNAIMSSLESLEFVVHVRSLKDENLHLGFDKLLGFHNLGTNSLQRVSVNVNCEGANIWDVEDAEAALKRVATVHPKHPILLTNREHSSSYLEACVKLSRAPELVTKAWQLADIIGSGHIQILRMPDPEASSSKVVRLLYTDDGVKLLSLSSSAINKLWKWEPCDKSPLGKSSKSVPPILWQSIKGIPVKNDTTNGNDPEEATACIALSKNDRYLISASGGKVSMFDMFRFEVKTTFMAPPPAATFLAFHPLNINIILIGMEDSSIQIYDIHNDKVRFIFPTCHQKKITGLAFSLSMDVVVSSGADAQVCVWNMVGWKKKKSRYIQPPSDLSGALVGDTTVQFHFDETRLLVVHESQLVIYDLQLECLCSWFPRDALPAPISSAVYSLGCLLVYAGFCDGGIGIFEAESLTLRCRIAPSAYIPSFISSDSESVYPTVLATHPWRPNRIAAGMSDGAVYVLEPLDTDDDGQVESDSSYQTSTH